MVAESKQEKYLKLVNKRRNDLMLRVDGFPEESKFTQVETWHKDCFNSYVTPFTKSACNYDSPIMIVAQDWGSSDSMIKISQSDKVLGYTPNLSTNKNLHILLNKFFKLRFDQVYATNLFVFIKPGSISSRISNKLLDYSAKKYTAKEIELVTPKLVICLGAATYSRLVFALTNASRKWSESLDNPINYKGSYIVGVPHTGGLGTAKAGGFSAIEAIWKKVADFYNSL